MRIWLDRALSLHQCLSCTRSGHYAVKAMAPFVAGLAQYRHGTLIRAMLLGVVLCSQWGCPGAPEVPPEKRMRLVTFADEDRIALADPRFIPFREALLLIRLKEAQRPVSLDVPLPAAALSTFNTELEAVTISAMKIVRTDGWSWDDRQLMNRALRSAQTSDLQSQ